MVDDATAEAEDWTEEEGEEPAVPRAQGSHFPDGFRSFCGRERAPVV